MGWKDDHDRRFPSQAPVSTEIIDEYRGRVPDEVVEICEEYGCGTFGEGFLRIIDPKLYEAEVGDSIGRTQDAGRRDCDPDHGDQLRDTLGLGNLKTFLTLTRVGGAVLTNPFTAADVAVEQWPAVGKQTDWEGRRPSVLLARHRLRAPMGSRSS